MIFIIHLVKIIPSVLLEDVHLGNYLAVNKLITEICKILNMIIDTVSMTLFTVHKTGSFSFTGECMCFYFIDYLFDSSSKWQTHM